MKILKLDFTFIYDSFISSQYLNDFINIKENLLQLLLSTSIYSFREDEQISLNLNDINIDYNNLYTKFFTNIIKIEYTDSSDGMLSSIEDNYLLWLEEKLHLKLNENY